MSEKEAEAGIQPGIWGIWTDASSLGQSSLTVCGSSESLGQRKSCMCRAQWHTLVILVTWEAEARESQVQGQADQVSETPFQKWVGVAGGGGSEVKHLPSMQEALRSNSSTSQN